MVLQGVLLFFYSFPMRSVGAHHDEQIQRLEPELSSHFDDVAVSEVLFMVADFIGDFRDLHAPRTEHSPCFAQAVCVNGLNSRVIINAFVARSAVIPVTLRKIRVGLLRPLGCLGPECATDVGRIEHVVAHGLVCIRQITQTRPARVQVSESGVLADMRIGFARPKRALAKGHIAPQRSPWDVKAQNVEKYWGIRARARRVDQSDPPRPGSSPNPRSSLALSR